MSETQHDSRYSWVRLGISLALAMVGSIGMWAAIIVLPAMQADFGISRAAASLPFTLTMTGFAFGNFYLGPATDRWGIAPVLAVAAVIQSVGFALSAMVPCATLVTLLHFLLGFGAGAAFAPLIADASQWFLRRRGIAVAIVASGNYLAGTVWPTPLVWVMEDYGWRGAYVVLALAVALILLPGTLLLRRRIDAVSTARATSEAAAKADAANISPRTLQILLCLAGIGCCIAMAMPQVHIIALCIDRGFGATVGAEILSLMLAGGILSRLAFGMFSDRFGGLMTLFVGGTLQMLALCLFLIEGGASSLYIVALIFGLSQGGIVPSYAVIVREYMPPIEAGRRVGIVIGATIVGMAFGGWVSGWIYDLSGSYRLAFWNGIAWNAFNVGIVLMLLIRTGPRTRTQTA